MSIYQQSCRPGPGHNENILLCSRGWCPTGQSVTRESYLQITTESVAGRDLADSRPPIPQNILKMPRSPVSKRYSFSSSSCGNVHTSNASAFLQAEFIKHLPKTSPILMLNSHLCEEHLILWKYSRENSVASSDQKLTTLLFVLLFPTRSWFSSFLFILISIKAVFSIQSAERFLGKL